MFKSILNLEKNVFAHDPSLVAELALDQLLYSKEFQLLDFVSCDEEVIRSRNEVIEDVIHDSRLAEIFCSLASDLQYIKNITGIRENRYASETHLFSLKQLEIYLRCVDTVMAGEAHFLAASSHGVRLFFDYMKEIAESEEYQLLAAGTRKLLVQIGGIKSITVGFNFHEDLSLKEGGILSINTQPIASATLTEKLFSLGKGESEISSIAPLTTTGVVNRKEREHLNEAFYAALTKWFRKNISQWQPSVDRYLRDRCGVLLGLLPELLFIGESVRIQNRLKELGVPLCRPVIDKKENKTFSVRGFYNPVTALRIGASQIVTNDFAFDRDGMLYIFTGPNQGGKSVFTCGVGIVQIFAQLGWLVPAQSAVISPVTGLFVHFPIAATSSNTADKGRLGEECERLAGIIRRLDAYSLILLDETLSSTDASEAVYIACDALKAISTYGCRGIYSTHLHEIVNMTEKINECPECRSPIDYLRVCVSRSVRTYKVVREKSDGKSYAEDIAKKYGLTYDRMKNKETPTADP